MQDLKWWQRGIIYQIYPRSFQDSNGDGIGDIQGIIQRLDHFVTLGVDAIWLSPIYPSPMADFGYDVADYCDVAPMFGTLTDLDRLVVETHSRGLKIILDFVPNHTSVEHPWFRESRSSRDGPKRDWYIWRDSGAQGGYPNNWLSHFGGPAWEWDDATKQYYYHSFLKEQPDLNWRNPAVKQAMYDVLRFWLDRGVDGFRVDVLWLLIKDDQFRDNPLNPGYVPGQPSHNRLLPFYTANRPEVHTIVHEMRSVIDAYPDRVLIGEIYLPIKQLVTYYGSDLRGANLPFNFQLLQTAWNPASIARIMEEYEAALPQGAWPNWVLGNHDNPRIASKIGAAQARVAAMLLLTLRGTPTVYYGEEIGMTNVPIPRDEVQDPAEKNEPGLGFGRDPERTPMPWDNSLHAGFTSGEPWLPLGPDHANMNVAILRNSSGSILNLYRWLIELRRDHRELTCGVMSGIGVEGNVLRFERSQGNQRLAILLNLGHEEAWVSHASGRLLLSTYLDRAAQGVGESLLLRPDEGIIVQVKRSLMRRRGSGFEIIQCADYNLPRRNRERSCMQAEPNMDLAHLGHLELLTPKPEESLRFFINVMGMTESGREGNSVFLRGYDDYERHSLKLTASKLAGMGHVAYRTRSQQALDRRVAALTGSGFDIGWNDGDLAHGPAFVCQDPDGHKIELYYETQWYEAPTELRPALKNQAQRFPARGINVRRLDHWNGLAVDIKANREFFEKYLGFRLTEQIVLDNGSEAAMWMTCTNKSYDFAYSRDDTGTKGRFHHVTYAVNSREEVLLAADIFLENGVYIETGPHKHAIQQTFFLYVYEPGGNRVEVANAGARLILAPDWKPIRWTEAERKKGQAWGLKTIESFHTYGTPPVEVITKH